MRGIVTVDLIIFRFAFSTYYAKSFFLKIFFLLFVKLKKNEFLQRKIFINLKTNTNGKFNSINTAIP